MWGDHSDWIGRMGGLMGIGWILILVVIVAVVWTMMRGPLAGRGGYTERRRALDILEERYARSEISREEFEQKRRDLEA